MSFLSKDRLIFDASDAATSDNVGAYVTASDGTLIDKVTITAVDRLAVDTTLNDGAGNDITSTGGALDVNIASGADLDIRDLVHTQDSIDLGDGTSTWDLQTLDAAFNDTGVSVGIAGVRQDAGGSPVSADGDAHPLVFNDDGELKVAADLTSSVGDDDVDSGNPVKIGSRSQGGPLTAVSADGDRADLLSDAFRRIWVNDTPNISAATTVETVGTTQAEIVSSALAGRRRLMVQNLGNKDIYIGEDSAVTTANGIRIARGATMELPWGEDINIHAISGTAGQDVRVLELA